jgi:hypothetical protein
MIKKLVNTIISAVMAAILIQAPVQAKESLVKNPLSTESKTIYIGDSRTVGMYFSVQDDSYREEIKTYDDNGDYWCAKVGAGYTWFSENFDEAVKEAEKDDTVVVLMGVNDCRDLKKSANYANFLNERIDALSALGIDLVYVSVNPISKDTIYSTVNKNVIDWNEQIIYLLDEDIMYLDIYAAIIDKIEYAGDGLHYQNSTYKDLYEMINEKLAVIKDGIKIKPLSSL